MCDIASAGSVEHMAREGGLGNDFNYDPNQELAAFNKHYSQELHWIARVQVITYNLR